MSATIVPTTTGVVIHMQPAQQPATQQPALSTAVSSTQPAAAGTTLTSSTKMSMSTSSTSSKTTKVTKTTKTSSSYSTKSTSSSSMTSGGKTTSHTSITTRSSGTSYSDNLASMLGIDASKEMERLQQMVQEEMSRMKSDAFSLKRLTAGEATPESSVVRLDRSSIMDYVDKANSDNLRFNFDMGEYSSESVNVRTVGNQIEVHAQRKTKTADGETSEEYSRTYEMPTNAAIEPDKVTSSLFKEGVLTVQLPVSEALREDKPE